MTDEKFTNSQSPRASRDSTNVPEKFSHGAPLLLQEDAVVGQVMGGGANLTHPLDASVHSGGECAANPHESEVL